VWPGSLLMRHGSWLLAAVGVAQIALAGTFRNAQDVAPAFAFLGAACVVLAVVLERAEGDLELSPGRMRIVLRALAGRPEIGAATGEAVVDALNSQLGRRRLTRQRAASEVAESVAREVAAGMASGAAAEERAAAWFKREGWEVERMNPHGFPYDLVVSREAETMYVEIKAGVQPLDVGVIERVLTLRSFIPSVVQGETRYGIWAATPGVTGAALKLARSAGIAVFVEQQPRGVSQFN
jgi:hypothetical protein